MSEVTNYGIVLPANWTKIELKRILTLLGGFAFKSNEYVNEGIPVLRMGNIQKNFKLNLHKKDQPYISEPRLSEFKDFLLEGEDIVMSLTDLSGSGAFLGTVAKLSKNEKALLNQRVSKLIIPDNLNKYFIFYALQAPSFRDYMIGDTTGSLQRNTSHTFVLDYEFPLPPLPEQHRIVAKIEELFTRLDVAVDELKKAKAQIKRYRQSVLKHAFEGKLTEDWRKKNQPKETAEELLAKIKEERKKALGKKYKELPLVDTTNLPRLPEGWVWSNIGEIGNIETGSTPSKKNTEYFGKDFPFYKPTDLNAGYYTRISDDGLTIKGMELARFLPAKSILVTCIGATIGKTGLIRNEGASNQQINAIIPFKILLPEYIYFYCISEFCQRQIIDNASSTTLPILNKSKFEILPIVITSFNEQQQIVSEIERHFSVADETEKIIDQSLKQAERLRQSILKAAFSGKLVPQDPNDEPAEKLLERIKTERQKY